LRRIQVGGQVSYALSQSWGIMQPFTRLEEAPHGVEDFGLVPVEAIDAAVQA